jgi:hypothetical protein
MFYSTTLTSSSNDTLKIFYTVSNLEAGCGLDLTPTHPGYRIDTYISHSVRQIQELLRSMSIHHKGLFLQQLYWDYTFIDAKELWVKPASWPELQLVIVVGKNIELSKRSSDCTPFRKARHSSTPFNLFIPFIFLQTYEVTSFPRQVRYRVTKFSRILEKSSEKGKICVESVRGSDLSIVARDVVLDFLKIPENLSICWKSLRFQIGTID